MNRPISPELRNAVLDFIDPADNVTQRSFLRESDWLRHESALPPDDYALSWFDPYIDDTCMAAIYVAIFGITHAVFGWLMHGPFNPYGG